MAKKKGQSEASNFQSGIDAGTSSFTKGLTSDYDENFVPESTWVYARNAINNSLEGDVGLLGNESSNYLCASAPYTIIGRIHLFEQYWVIFSTSNFDSEIGVYDEDQCNYRTVVNDKCLEFSLNNLITGVAKENSDCSWSAYFADGKNPDRYINLGNPDLWPTGTYTGNNYYDRNQLWPGVQWDKSCTVVNNCTICTELNTLNCDRLRINSLVKTPCIKLTAGQNGGNLYNGSYLVTIAYTINGQKYGDYMTPSNVQYIFNHDNIAGALDIEITNLETESFTEFELVVISVIDQATNVRKIGNYAVSDKVFISIDTIDETRPAIPLSTIPIRTPLYETSESMFTTSNYLLRIAPRTTFDFNYQPLANQISAEWVAVRYPADYYKNGGYVTGYMRDEVYAFWIRWVYNTGEKSNSYHIPGRVSTGSETTTLYGGSSVIYDGTEGEKYFEVFNTASVTSTLFTTPTAEDGGVPIARGSMAYWESTELYPDRNPEVWNATYDSEFSGGYSTDYDLCNKPIRHHKFPEDVIGTNSSYTRATASGASTATFINVMGVQFSNIKPPVYRHEDGTIRVIPGIVGYEILRSSRQGNKTVIAKGIINNMRSYTSPLTNQPVLYQNFPYNPVKARFGSTVDPTLSLTAVAGNGSNYSAVTEANVRKDFFTFHSPDTSFYRPYLLTKELRLYTELGADNNVQGQFEQVPGHPKHKLLTDFAFIVSSVIGMIEASYAMAGKKTATVGSPRVLSIGMGPGAFVGGSGYLSAPFPAPPAVSAATIATAYGAQTLGNFFSDLLGGQFVNSITGIVDPIDALYVPWIASDLSSGVLGAERGMQHERSGFDNLPLPIRIAAGAITFFSLTGTATQNNIDLIYSLVKYRQYTVRYISHGVLHKDNVGNVTPTNKRKFINNAAYLSNSADTFQNLRINNIYRSSSVVLNITDNAASTTGTILNPSLTDTTVNSLSQNVTGGPSLSNPFKQFKTTASCYYAGLKVRFRNQYGQLDSIIQLPTGCAVIVNNNDPIPQSAIVHDVASATTVFVTTYSTPILFGGDTYIGRYTEKNSFFYFNEWLYNQPDGTEFNYNEYYLGLYPRYWADFTKYEVQGILASIVGNLSDPGVWNVPSNYNNLDQGSTSNSSGLDVGLGALSSLSFGKKNSYFYLFQSGVRDFYVESDINIDQRDWGEIDEQKYYPILSNLTELFDPRIIKSGNYFKINPSVSISRLFSNVTTWGTMQSRYYNPTVSSLCYQYLTNRIIYSLPSNVDQIKDFWRVFLPNNYRDFISPVTAVRPIGKNGALILFKHDSPVMFQGSETLETDIGTKLTIGDGQLFSQPLQSVVNSDESYEYGSCQDKFSVINTPAGVYYISQNQGKIFSLGSTLEEISALGKRWWFSKFLPMRLLVDFPDFELTDNPVVGVGCQAIYDNDFQLLYFCKKDYELRKDLPSSTVVTYTGSGRVFQVNGGQKIFLGDPNYFNDVSWTISYDPKQKSWLSYHDWHPDMTIPSKLNFISTKGATMWRHNDTTASYCNFYGIDYPFQIEYVQNTGQTVSTLKSIEYIMEAYVYDIDGIDRFQVLDYNFDDLVVYNTEQVSGLLKLNSAPKIDPFARLNYPQINPNNIDVLYEKQEQKIRINQFWDVTDDRGEFNPSVQRPIWLTSWDGYKRELNPANIDYNKSVFERKKFRHYFANVLLSKSVSNNVKMLMKIANNKTLSSPR
jgi:hypothetical protein